jgi:DNA-directed RNA polymerase subunit M/transcription elongation factor TFIIS
VDRVKVEGELSSCPKCGGERGFHVAFRSRSGKGERTLDVFLVCPHCGFQFTVGEFLLPDGEPRPFDPTLDGGQ